MASGFYNVKVLNNLTIDSNEVRNNEGEVEASSTVIGAKNFEPHMFKKRKAMAVHRSFSCTKS